MAIPTHLEHKPIIGVDNYDTMDGIYANDSDAQSLSIGEAQYDKNQISAKVFRQVNGTWSRQSEELPLHRVLDLAILILGTMTERPAAVTNLNEQVVDTSQLRRVQTYFRDAHNKQHLQPRIEELRRLLQLKELVNY